MWVNRRIRRVGAPAELKAAFGPGATLEDVFRHFVSEPFGDSEEGDLRETARARSTARRLG